MATKRQGKPSKVVAMSLALLLSSQAVVPYAYASEQVQGSDQIEPAALSAASEKTASEKSAVDETTYAADAESVSTESANAKSSSMESAGAESADKSIPETAKISETPASSDTSEATDTAAASSASAEPKVTAVSEENSTSGADAVPSASAAPKAFSTFSAPAASAAPATAANESGANANDDELASFVTPPKLATIDNREHYITINLFDYPDGDDRSGVNHYTDYYFRNPLRFNHWMSNYTGGKVVQGIVKARLGEDGYPILNSSDERSMAYLFDPNKEEEGKKIYADLSHLLSESEDGTISFNSDKHYAWYPLQTGGGDFIVYDGTYTVRGESGAQIPVGFVPFNSYDENNQIISPDGPFDHHFGLTLSTNFKMPKDAVVNDKDMVFDFTGDDDVWVFIDGVLVLDMGGVHGKRSGAINFKTGEVTVDNVASSVPGRPASIDTIGPVSTIADIFAKQGLTFDNSENSKHSLSLFYVERGGHESNLSMKFNLPTVAEHEPDPDPLPDPNTDPDPDPTTDPDPAPDPNIDPDPQPTPDPDPVPSPDPNPGVNPNPNPDPNENTSTVTGNETQNNQAKAKQASSASNQEKALPKTTDTSNFGILVGLGALAFAGGIGIFFARKMLRRK